MGAVMAPEDMPVSAVTGLAPDLIMNPHGYPSRMTIGNLLEAVTGKAGLILGERLNATAFRDADHEVVRKVLKSAGFAYNGTEPYIDGQTGEMLEGMVFSGPVYYQIQKHQVTDKIHGRPRGDVSTVFRQAPEGRARNGGLRVGDISPQSRTITVRLVDRRVGNTSKLREHLSSLYSILILSLHYLVREHQCLLLSLTSFLSCTTASFFIPTASAVPVWCTVVKVSHSLRV